MVKWKKTSLWHARHSFVRFFKKKLYFAQIAISVHSSQRLFLVSFRFVRFAKNGTIEKKQGFAILSNGSKFLGAKPFFKESFISSRKWKVQLFKESPGGI